jgi:hypothetical protein
MLVSAAIIALALGTNPADSQELTKAQVQELATYFGFGPIQIYKLDPEIELLELADLNHDGRTDIALWNPHKSRFELFYQPDPDQPPADRVEQLERNEIASRGDLRREHVAVPYRVSAMKIADVTGDGLPDLIFFGEPRELVILPGKPDGGFGAPDAVRAPDGEPRNSFVQVGDFNHDGRTDVALLGEEVLQVFYQKPGGGLDKPVRLVHGIRQPMLMLTADINGDGRDDLAIGLDDDQYGLYVYLQDADGGFSALRRVKVPRLRSMTFAKGPQGADLFSVEATTGHLKEYRWQVQEDSAGTPDWPQRLYSYPIKMEGRRLPFAVADLNGDGLPDCVTADPAGSQLVFLPGTEEGFGAGKAFPGLVKTVDLQIADIDGDGKPELLSVSPAERTLGVSRFEDGRLTFPKPLPIAGEPLVAVVGMLKTAGGEPCLAYVCREHPGQEQQAMPDEEVESDEEKENAPVSIRFVKPGTGEELQRLACELEDDPSGLRFVDVNHDGLNDLLLFTRFATLQTFLQDSRGRFAPLAGREARSGLVRDARPEAFCAIDVSGDGQGEIILSQKNLARALAVQDGRWNVVDQYNADTSGAEITGLAALPGEPGSPTLVLYDRKGRHLLVLKRGQDKTYSVVQSMPVGDFDVCAMTAVAIGPQHRPGVLLADSEKLALFRPDELAPTLVAQHSYETDVKDGWLADAAIGDLNHDGIRDVLVIDMRKASLDILTEAPGGDLVRAMRFQVFQGKRFSSDPNQMGEPHECRIGDVTGDGTADIVLLVHDRLIVYPGQ